MSRLCLFLALFPLAASSAMAASLADAQRVQKSYELSVEKWNLEARLAETAEQRAQILSSRPDSLATARELWQVIGGSLKQEWTLEPAAWFVTLTRGLTTQNADGSQRQPAFLKENDAILAAAEEHHSNSKNLVPLCIALAGNGSPRALDFLDKVQANHPDAHVQGVAALCQAISLKSLGDETDLMRKRLTLLRKAIIQSADVEVNGTTVAQLAEDELYVIRYLAKGRVAPDLSGTDAARRPLKLSQHAGKVVVLLFWQSDMPNAQETIEITNRLTEKFRNRPLAVLGVNHDPFERLRALQGDETVKWQNFTDPDGKLAREYRVAERPAVFVLDGDRKIHYAGLPGSFVELTAEALVSEARPVENE